MTFHIPGTKFVFVKRLNAYDDMRNFYKNNPYGLRAVKKTGELSLHELEKTGAIHKVEGSPHEEYLRKELEKRHGITDVRGIYLAPVKQETGGDSLMHRRAKFITRPNGALYQFKGIGNNSSAPEDRNMEETIRIAQGSATIPFKPREEGAFGAYSEDLSRGYFVLSRIFAHSWRHFLRENKPIAKLLNAPKEPPFAMPIEHFEYMDVVARKNFRRAKSRYVRVPSEYQKVLTIIKAQGSTHRIEHLASDDATQKEKEQYWKETAQYYKIKNFKPKTDVSREVLFKKIADRLLSCYLAIRIHSNFAMHKTEDGELKNVLGAKDFNGVMFFDTDSADVGTDKNIEKDVSIVTDILHKTIRALNLEHKKEKLIKYFSYRFNDAANMFDNSEYE